MKKDYSGEVKKLIKKYAKEDIEYAKPLDYLLFRNKATKESFEKDLFNFKKLEFTEKQTKGKETRYALYFVYNRRKGRVYAIKFDKKIKIITIYPLGKKTLLKYRKKRFKKRDALK